MDCGCSGEEQKTPSAMHTFGELAWCRRSCTAPVCNAYQRLFRRSFEHPCGFHFSAEPVRLIDPPDLRGHSYVNWDLTEPPVD